MQVVDRLWETAAERPRIPKGAIVRLAVWLLKVSVSGLLACTIKVYV